MNRLTGARILQECLLPAEKVLLPACVVGGAGLVLLLRTQARRMSRVQDGDDTNIGWRTVSLRMFIDYETQKRKIRVN